MQHNIRISSPKKYIVFDWDTTLLQFYPQTTAVKTDQRKDEELNAVFPMLDQLKRHHPLIIISLSNDSNQLTIRNSLDHLGIGEYFSSIFTSMEWKNLYPDLTFFEKIERELSISSKDIILFGENFSLDILESFRAGWECVWYNKDIQSCPGLAPVQNGEAYAISEFPGSIIKLSIPSWNTCLAWLLQEGSSENLLLHVQTVAACAYQMAIWLKAGGEKLDPILAHRGGFLHDLAKISPQRKDFPDLDHGSLGAKLLLERNQPELAEIAFRHMIFSVAIPERAPRTWEEKLVYFADKIVEGSRVVHLDERLDALKKRYQTDNTQYRPAILSIQAEICDKLNLTPLSLIQRVQDTILRGTT
jgi:putative nucleotidyltransferase with HDIG domain